MNNKILIIEDDRSIRNTVRDVLELEGYEVQAAENGYQGLNILSEGFRPGLMLVDLNMPQKDGWSFHLERMNNPNWKDFPIVFFSADSAMEKKVSSHVSSLPVLKKPIDLDDLLETVKNSTTN